eukprot:6815862-Alexandrium_andersonii.AAC.1
MANKAKILTLKLVWPHGGSQAQKLSNDLMAFTLDKPRGIAMKKQADNLQKAMEHIRSKLLAKNSKDLKATVGI